MSEASSLSQMSVSDEYEDLVFRKVMAIYIANESARISSEVEKANAEGETTVNSKTINRLFSKANSKKYLRHQAFRQKNNIGRRNARFCGGGFTNLICYRYCGSKSECFKSVYSDGCN